jgi:predicted GNAT family acetyltransferase
VQNELELRKGVILKMMLLTPEQTATLKTWFLPERPGPLIGLHVIHTGNGACFVDRWPAPQAMLVETASNYSLLGDAQALTPADLQPHIRGFVETSQAFIPLLTVAFPDMRTWPRVILAQPEAPGLVTKSDYSVRRLELSDTYHLWGLSPESTWISKTWGGPQSLASSGFAWGAFVAGKLASVACSFFLGQMYEEIGVATEPDFRGLGLSTACARALCNDIRDRGRQASWTTSPDNTASLRVAEKLGFAVQRQDQLYVVGISIPEPANS